jgi:hypothetical protein
MQGRGPQSVPWLVQSLAIMSAMAMQAKVPLSAQLPGAPLVQFVAIASISGAKNAHGFAALKPIAIGMAIIIMLFQVPIGPAGRKIKARVKSNRILEKLYWPQCARIAAFSYLGADWGGT